MMVEDYYTIDFNIDIKEAMKEIMLYTSAIYGLFGLLRRMGFGEEFNEITGNIMNMIAKLNMLRVSLISVQAAAGPVGWALAGISVAGTIMTMSEVG